MVVALVSCLGLMLAACGGGSDARPDSGMSDGDAGSQIDAGSQGIDCQGVFDCVGLCADGDDPCVKACLARGTPTAVALVTDLVKCGEANACVDENCLSVNCANEIRACGGGTTTCNTVGVPEMTGPIAGLGSDYAAGDPMTVSVPVDEDTRRVIVGIYEVGSNAYLGGTADDAAPSSVKTLDFRAGVVGGAVGTYYLSVELCSTSVCTTPFIRNTYQRADRTASFTSGETYTATNEHVGGPAMTESCPTAIPIQTFQIH
ncbi:MAG: hypothetical protein KC503_28140 [Myxococcales bacterium]|nr:hypothetical protein [Myxococcales bacterium]